MRTLDEALTSEQQESSRKPYLRIYFDDGAGDTHTYTTKDATNRVAYVEQWEEPYAGVTIIRLSNYDGEFTSVDWRGYQVSVGWGYELNSTPDSTWYSNAAKMWVNMQRDISYEGMLVTEFYCVSVMAKFEMDHIIEGGKKIAGTIAGTFELAELVTQATTGATGRVSCISDGYIVVVRETGTFSGSYTCTGGTSGATVTSVTVTTNYGMLIYASGDTNTEARIESLTGLTVDVDEDDDLSSMADTPLLMVETGTSVRQVIRQMLLRTKCGMRFENDGHLHVLYLDTSDTANYTFDADHPFTANLREQAMILPNAVIVVSAQTNAEQAPLYMGSANNSDSVAKFGTIYAPIQVDPSAESNGDCDNTAAAWISQRVAEAYQGKIVAQMECGLEVYDMVQTEDARLNVTAKGRIGRLERVFEPSSGTYEISLYLGSLYSEPGAMDVGGDSRDNDLKDITSMLTKTPPQRAIGIVPWQLWKSVQPYTVDIAFSQSSTTGDNAHMSWGSGTIYFADGTSLSISANADYAIGATPGWLYFTEEDSTLNFTDDFSVAVAPHNGIVAFIARGTETGTTCLIIPYAGKEPALNADIISCIFLSALAASLGTVKAGTFLLDDGNLIFYESSTQRGYIYPLTDGLAVLGDSNLELLSASGGGVSIGAGAAPPTPVANDLQVRAEGDVDIIAGNGGAGEVYISSGGLTGSPGTDDIWLDSDDDIWFYADSDILLKPDGNSYIEHLEIKHTRHWSGAGDLTSERAVDTAYQPSTTYAVLVVVAVALNDVEIAYLYMEESDSTPDEVVDTAANSSSDIAYFTMVTLVPPGGYYMLTCEGSIVNWVEYRIGASA